DAVARQPEHGPFMQLLCPHRPIKLYPRFVPIEHSPFHPTAAPLPRNFRKLNEQCAPVTFAAQVRFHEQIFEVKPRPPKPGGKIMKVNCEPNWRLPFKREEHFRSRPFPEQYIDKLFLCSGHFVWCTLIGRQIANQFKNDWHI